MNSNEPPREQERPAFTERRKRTDWVSRMATILSVLSWTVASAVIFVLDKAKPEQEHMFTRMFGIKVRDYWDETILPIAFTLLIISLGSCIFAFIFNMLRMKRKTDKYKKSIFIIGIISIMGIIYFVIRFGV